MRRLLALMNGQREAPLTRLPTTMVARRSCGCSKSQVLIDQRSPGRAGRSLEAAVVERRALIFAELSPTGYKELDRAHLVDARELVSDLTGRGLLADGRLTDAGRALTAGIQADIAAQTAP